MGSTLVVSEPDRQVMVLEQLGEKRFAMLARIRLVTHRGLELGKRTRLVVVHVVERSHGAQLLHQWIPEVVLEETDGGVRAQSLATESAVDRVQVDRIHRAAMPRVRKNTFRCEVAA